MSVDDTDVGCALKLDADALNKMSAYYNDRFSKRQIESRGLIKDWSKEEYKNYVNDKRELVIASDLGEIYESKN
jgi:hypothetical protein